ncbi:MAG TPA: hypothetical protein VLN91_01345, partial [Nitrospirota bacterium]|nr:hypothetical protein [Nitrospirota bacterium]
NIDWTAGWLNENKNNLTDRKGFITQIWGVSSYRDDRVTVGFGVGPYIAQDRLRDQNSGKIFMSGAVSFTSAYRFGRVWDARFSWSRIITGYDRDSDVIMLGLGYRY